MFSRMAAPDFDGQEIWYRLRRPEEFFSDDNPTEFLCHFCFLSLSYIYGSRLHYLQDSCLMIFQGEGIRIWKCRRCQDLVSGQIIAAAKSISTKLITHIDVKKPYKLSSLMELCESIYKRQIDLFKVMSRVWQISTFFQDKNDIQHLSNLYWKSIIYKKSLCVPVKCYLHVRKPASESFKTF